RSAPNERGGRSLGLEHLVSRRSMPGMLHPWARAGSRRFPGDPSYASALLQDPGRADKISPVAVLPTPPPAYPNRRPQRVHNLEANTGLQHPLSTLHERRRRLPCKTRFRLAGLRLYREGVEPSGSLRKVSGYITILLSRTCPVARVVYAKRPFGGPERVLDYLGRYTHRVAIANSRLVGLAAGRGQLPLEGLSPPRQAKGDEPWRRRVHSPLPAPRPARWLPSHPPLRLSRQRSTRRQARRLPPSAGGPRAGAARPCCRLPRALPAAHRPLTRPLSGLRRPHDRHRRHPPCQHFRR